MSKPTLAESGWLEYVIKEHLRPALDAAERTASDLDQLRMCDAADCGRMFDSSDPRCLSTTQDGIRYDFCPACEMEAQARSQITSQNKEDRT